MRNPFDKRPGDNFAEGDIVTHKGRIGSVTWTAGDTVQRMIVRWADGGEDYINAVGAIAVLESYMTPDGQDAFTWKECGQARFIGANDRITMRRAP